MFVRRAFTYLASDKAGIVRFGQTDGVHRPVRQLYLHHPVLGRRYRQLQRRRRRRASGPAGAVAIPFVWLAQAGAEYDNNKIVYLSPQFFGFDFGVQYAPNMGNSFQNEAWASAATRPARPASTSRPATIRPAGSIRSASACASSKPSARWTSRPMASTKPPARKT